MFSWFEQFFQLLLLAGGQDAGPILLRVFDFVVPLMSLGCLIGLLFRFRWARRLLFVFGTLGGLSLIMYGGLLAEQLIFGDSRQYFATAQLTLQSGLWVALLLHAEARYWPPEE
jgi:hypothetical protein